MTAQAIILQIRLTTSANSWVPQVCAASRRCPSELPSTRAQTEQTEIIQGKRAKGPGED